MFIIYLLFNHAFCETLECPEGQGWYSFADGCTYCDKDEGLLEDGRCGRCPGFQGIDYLTGKCRDCIDNECVDPLGYCTILPSDMTKDPINKRCTCPNFQGFNSSNLCEPCKEFFCVDQITKQCVNTEYVKFGIDEQTGACISCPAGQRISYETKKCIVCPEGSPISDDEYCESCPAGQIHDLKTNKCVTCKEGEHIINSYECGACPRLHGVLEDNRCFECRSYEGIDPDTLKCRSVPYNKGVDYNGFIIDCPSGSSSKSDSCICNINDYYLNENNECGICNKTEGFGYDYRTKFCIKCEAPLGFKTDTSQCRECDDTEYLDPETKTCTEKSKSNKYCYVLNNLIEVPSGARRYFDFCKCKDENLRLDIDTLECRETQINDIVIQEDYFIQKCPLNYCIDPNNGTCKEPGPLEAVDPETQSCTECEAKKGIDPKTNQCHQCRWNECISIFTGQCVELGGGNEIDPTSKKCKCPEKQGFSYGHDYCMSCNYEDGILENGNCGQCPESQCIDDDTRHCRDFKENEVLNMSSKECIICPSETTPDPSSNLCICNDENKHFDYETGTCIECDVGQIFDSGECFNCDVGFGIVSGKCQKCPYGQGIDNETKLCVQCPANEGILPIINICGKCPENSVLNETSKECDCNAGYIKTKSGCEKCGNRQYPSKDKTYCRNLADYYRECIDPVTYQGYPMIFI